MTKPPARTLSIDRKTIEHFWQAGLRYKSLLLRLSVFPLGILCLSTLVPLFIGRILATLGRTGGHPMHYVPYFLVAAVLGVLGNRFGFAALVTYQAQVMRDLQTEALDTLLRRSVGFHNNNIGGKLVSDAIEYSSSFGLLANTFYTSVVPLVITLFSGSIIIFWESWQLGLLVLTMVMFAVGSGYSESRRRSGLRKDRLVANKDMTAHLADTIVNVQTVKTFAREDAELTRSDSLSETLMAMRLRDWRLAGIRGNNRILVLLALQALFVIVVVRVVQQHPALLGIGIFAFSYTITLSNKLFDINTMLRSLEDGLLQASNMTEIMQQAPEINDAPDAKALQVTHGGIQFNNLSFRYPDSPKKQSVFNALTLDIKPGEKIGLVGPSGGGKSTLTRLLLRFEDIDNGEVLIDGQNIAQITQASLRKAISYVPQEPLLFHRTVAENISYGAESASHADIVRAAKAAHADDFIRELPQGYKTTVGERGVKLSGGQRQRIAIARAILKDAPILVLDEATSALDSESELFIQSALQKLMEQRTTIVIAHRLSTIQKMDRIVVLDHGAIVEQGPHQALLKQKGTYARLWAHQSGGFIEE